MKNLALIEREVREGCEAVLVSPFDFHGYVMELPRLRPEHRDGAIRYRLRALYPGDPANTCTDEFRPARTESYTTAFAVDEAVLAQYRSHKLPLIPGAALLAKAAEAFDEGSSVGILATPYWMQLAVFRNAVMTELVALEPNHGKEWFDHVTPTPPTVFLITLGMDDATTTTLAADFQPKGGKILVVDSQRLIETIVPDRAAIFPEKAPGRKIRQSTIASLLIIFNLAAAAIGMQRLALRAEKNMALAKSTYETRKDRAHRIEELGKEISRLEETLKSKGNVVRPAPYPTLSALYGPLSGGRLRSIILQDGSFRLEAEGVDALKVLAAMQNSERLRNVALHQAAPSEKGGELFTMSGYLTDE